MCMCAGPVAKPCKYWRLQKVSIAHRVGLSKEEKFMSRNDVGKQSPESLSTSKFDLLCTFPKDLYTTYIRIKIMISKPSLSGPSIYHVMQINALWLYQTDVMPIRGTLTVAPCGPAKMALSPYRHTILRATMSIPRTHWQPR